MDRRDAWIIKLRMGRPVSKFMRVCCLHFAEDDYFYRSKDSKKAKDTEKKLQYLQGNYLYNMTLWRKNHPELIEQRKKFATK
ncbi:hypothetical protein NQ318_005603 [Aromia moschata]|uniref:THAP-type domain-containing protein n=1 Tax=Aromia moschata TaxID=1265417 RepID=A0AAV8XUB5_9CUCU|nr:hypothetical protein NQ318_005603 [Aromia moschata]